MPLRREELGLQKYQKGTIDGKRFPIWDVVQDCEPHCPLKRDCIYTIEKKNGTTPKCKLQGSFLKTMMDITLDNLPDRNKTEYHLQKIGLTLIPLFKQLVTMQMLEQSLQEATLGEDNKLKIHPVYKEIRIITKDLDKCLVSLGIHLGASEMGAMKGAGDDAMGDPSYYESMQNDHEDEADIHSGKRKDL